jgi:polysaccharide deacetylase 2 family uncharacterized protein YibQ
MLRACGGLVLWLALAVAEAQPPTPVIAIVLDDLGNNLAQGREALALQGELTYAFLPHTPYAAILSRQAHATARESIVHLPMQSLNNRALGQGGLTLDMDETELQHTLMGNLASVPFAVGSNNHMGSVLTGNMEVMSKLMGMLVERGDMYFLDSRTHESTVAEQAARQAGLPTSRRDVFLDTQRDQAYISDQLSLLLAKAKQQGSAVAIGHPYPETLAVLARRLPELDGLGVELVPLSRLIEQQITEKPTLGLHNTAIVGTSLKDTTRGEH